LLIKRLFNEARCPLQLKSKHFVLDKLYPTVELQIKASKRHSFDKKQKRHHKGLVSYFESVANYFGGSGEFT